MDTKGDILLVDDDRDIRDSLQIILEQNGYAVQTAPNGKEALAALKMKTPDLMILDELFSGLSLAEVASMMPVIEKLRYEGKTIIMIEHRLKELFRIADRVMVLNYGEKIAEGAPKDVMENDEVKKAYLGTEA